MGPKTDADPTEPELWLWEKEQAVDHVSDLESNSDLFSDFSSSGTEKDTLCMQSIINGLESCYDQTWALRKFLKSQILWRTCTLNMVM